MDPLPVRAHEDAIDALARLDLACSLAPRAFSSVLRLASISALADAGPKGTRALVAAFSHANALAELPDDLRHWWVFIDEEERRSRGGAPLTPARLARVGLAHLQSRDDRTVPEAAIEHALRIALVPRPSALYRALDVAAAVGDRSVGEAAAAIVLCAEGRTDRVRLLPFGAVAVRSRDEATARWREGDRAAWTELALHALTVSARERRTALDRALLSLPDEDAALDPLGRAAITARRALRHLREELATSVPLLAAELGLSRPAADDSLTRLVELGLATETTGRRRDRVFAYSTALAITE